MAIPCQRMIIITYYSLNTY